MLVFIAPEELSIQTRNKLKKLGIDVLGYRWVDGEPVFPGLAHWQFRSTQTPLVYRSRFVFLVSGGSKVGANAPASGGCGIGQA
jgi:hypothetical protein